MTTPERAEAIKALAQLATMYHMSSDKSDLKADPTALRLRNRAAVLQLATHANISEEEAAERYYAQLKVADAQRRRDNETEFLRNATHGGVPYDYYNSSSSPTTAGSPMSGSNRRHYMSRRLEGGGGNGRSGSPTTGGSFAFGSESGGFGGVAGGVSSSAVYPPPPMPRDSAIGAIESLVTLANSYAATGRFTDAVRVIKRAIAFSENQFRPNDDLIRKSSKSDNNNRLLSPSSPSAGGGAGSAFGKSNTQTSAISSTPTVSSIHTPLNSGAAMNNNNNTIQSPKSTTGSPRRVGFAGDAQQQQQAFNIEVLKGVHDNHASYEDGDDLLMSGGGFLTSGGDIDGETNAFVNQPRLVPLLVLLSNYLEAEGSRHEAQCVRDRIRRITENSQGIGIFDFTNKRTDPREDVSAMKTVLTSVADQFDEREEQLYLASAEYRRIVQDELLVQRVGGGGGGGNSSFQSMGAAAGASPNRSQRGSSASLMLNNSSASSAFNKSTASGRGVGGHDVSEYKSDFMQRNLGGAKQRLAALMEQQRQSGDASPGSVAYVRNKNFYKYT